MFPRSLIVSVALLGTLLTATVIPGSFTIDENNYLVTVLGLRQGRLHVPGTDGLPPSRELLFFDPGAASRQVTSTPVAAAVPPLYAPLALPFSFLGWRGLVLLNTLAFLATILIAFALTKRFATAVDAPWIAAVAVGAGSYFIEYAQGMWPHMVAVGLVAGSVSLAANALDRQSWRWAAGAGLLAATATGVRYQNACVLVSVGLGLLLLARQRVRAATAFALGAALPLAVSSIMNHGRLGSWNPISKGPGYFPSPARISTSSRGFFGDAVVMAWARVVDYRARPPVTGTIHDSFLFPHPESGAYVLVTAVKKAWLQSSPWMILPLVLLVLAWLPAPVFARVAGPAPQRQLRMISLVVVLTLGMFSASGIYRTDGLCFNQRYFCELVPLVAVAFGWSVEGIARRRTVLLAGGLLGAILAFVALAPHPLLARRHYMLLYIPLAVAVLLGVAWVVWRSAGARSRPYATVALAFLVGAALAWATTVHLGDDVKASRIMRLSRQDYLRQLRPYLVEHSAVFASGSIKDALGPLQMERDVVIAAPTLDRAATAKALLDAFLAQGRRVFFLPNVLPADVLEEILQGKKVRYLGTPPLLIEVGAG